MPAMTTLQRGTRAFGAAMKALLALSVTLALLGVPQLFWATSVSAAAEPTTLTNVRLWVYPEYDDPRLLVMMEGSLPAGTQIPATVRFLVPTAAEMYSAGSMDSQGRYKGGPPNRQPSAIPGWDEISYDATTNVFRVEYYVDSIKGLPNKTFDFEFRTLYPINSLDIEVLQPAKGTGFTATPALSGRGTVEGMAAFGTRYSEVSVDKPLTFNIAYTKADSTPSVKPPSGAASQTSSPNLMWMLGILAAAVVGAGAIWYVSSSRRRRYKPAYRSARSGQRTSQAARASSSRMPVSQGAQRSPRSSRPAELPEEKGVFCRKCGTRSEGAAKFCKRCGARIG